jgi:proline-specific peptidase
MSTENLFHVTPKLLVLLLAAGLIFSCNEVAKRPTLLPPGENRLAVHGGNIWYRVSGTGKGTVTVLLHGGPGSSSFYLKPFEDLGNDRQIVRYDQLGGGKSDKITDTTMFTIDHFVAELESLRIALGVDRWNLLSHSWGTILAVEYYRVHPEHVVSLTLCSPALDIPAWEKNARELVTTLSDSAQRAIRRVETTKKYDDQSYLNAMNEFYGKYVVRRPVAADFDSTMATYNPDIYNYMQGPSEFTITGTLKNYDATPFLSQIQVPTLYTVGEFDQANPKLVERFASITPGAQVVVLPGAAHMTPWDARDKNVIVVAEFLRRVDSLQTLAE